MTHTFFNTAEHHDKAVRLRAMLRDFTSVDSAEERKRVYEVAMELGGSGIDGTGPVDLVALGKMLDCGASVNAVLTLMGNDTCFMLSRGQHDNCLASVIPADGYPETVAEAPTLTLALLAAFVLAVLSRLEDASLNDALEAPLLRSASRLH